MPELWLAMSADIPETRLAQLTRGLARDLSRAGVSANPVEVPPAAGERGDAPLLSQFAIALVSGGAVTALIGCLKTYLSRERTLAIKLRGPNGSLIEITSRNVDTAAVQEALQAVSSAKPG